MDNKNCLEWKIQGGITINFQPVRLTDKPLFDKYFRQRKYEGSECTFTNMYMWRNCYDIQWTVVADLLCIKALREEGEFVLTPFGSNTSGIDEVVNMLIEYFNKQNMPFYIKGLYSDMVSFYDELRPGFFNFIADRNNFDYVYKASDLIELKGRKFHGKKNHLNSFKQNYPDYQYLPLTKDLVPACIKYELEWCEQKGCDDDPSLKCEKNAVVDAFANFETLGFSGGVIMIGGKVEAFTFGEPINDEMAVIHVEKANPEIKGLYTAINQEFCAHAWPSMKYINREEDMGLEGLRKAKESYRPVKMVEKYDITLK